ncbi:MBL fold metallo-hydrolase [Agrobacterium larrymoorei]|uniref:MBL fold metallo-hydrolase n=2 Tax=Agrobacterium larrymoorei TaxID=160699 RepID=A0AAF0HDR0_9HYPH|nr:MBL fold metallo-hydrolase [Agrobacterium larrymoorei]WHA42471.1 MBL fold metallo-hydrolase [Agrobacterium larrymoorei]
MDISTETLRILNPYDGVYAYYDGRMDRRLYSEKPNWLDDGAYTLGTASYAIVSEGHALVYDTHMSLNHARALRRHLESLGTHTITVVLSHWHTDHIAGNEVFADCEIIALSVTARTMVEKRAELEGRDPPISPVIMPTRTFDRYLSLRVGARTVELHHFDIHSADGNVLWLPEEKILFAGDTLEDTVTYVSEPEHIPTHIEELKRLRAWKIEKILPNHGAEHLIASGGYEVSLIDANRVYLERLITAEGLVRAGAVSLKEFVVGELEDGSILYHPDYEVVHRQNVEAVERVRRA